MSTDSDCFLPEVCCLNSLASHKQSSSSERLNTISPGKDLRAANGVFVGKMVLEEKKIAFRRVLGTTNYLGFGQVNIYLWFMALSLCCIEVTLDALCSIIILYNNTTIP